MPLNIPVTLDAPRPWWYQASVRLEPLRPAFAWAVEHQRVVKLIGLILCAVLGGFASLVLGQQVGRRLARLSEMQAPLVEEVNR